MSGPILTFDVDWAPDHVIDEVAEHLISAQVRSTWFVTHHSAAIQRLRALPHLFELGIHPNFFPGSSHGSSVPEVLDRCIEMVPEAVSFRTHGLMQSTPLFSEILTLTNLSVDASLFIPHGPNLAPVDYWWEGKRLRRVPYIWEDDFEMMRPDPVWSIEDLPAGKGSGPVVIDLHPIHAYLNCDRMDTYLRLRRRAGSIQDASHAETSALKREGIGPATMLASVLEQHEKRGSHGNFLREVAGV